MPSPNALPLAVPAKQLLDLVFFRKVFYKLRRQLGMQDNQNGDIPLIAFQRAMGRLFRVLQIERQFDAKKYDLNGDGNVGWWEFCKIWREEQLAVNLTTAERIYITLEEPGTSRLGRFASVVVLSAIAVSACTFIVSTMPVMQEARCANCAPEPFEVFNEIDWCCVMLFTVEYFTRLITAAYTRIELLNEDFIVEAMCADEGIQWPTRFQRLVSFVLAWPNLIDLAAILPSYVTWILQITQDSDAEEGEEEPVVFKLIRLMRMVRAFRLGRKFEAVMVITRAMRRSSRALLVLVLNMALGMLIFGSIMFFIEGGTYDPKDGAYKRFEEWKFDSSTGHYEKVFGRSPFASIPDSFWWVLVTCTTVGYGDQYPTTTGGQVAAGITMVWSLCVLALPVGVIGANFAAVWDEYDSEKQDEDALRKNQTAMVRTALAHIEPISVSRRVYLAVYHNSRMPSRDNNVFIGEAECELELDAKSPHPVHKSLRFNLCENRKKSDRTVTGSIFMDYTWSPLPYEESRNEILLHGKLVITMVRAVDLAPIDWTNPGFADPYVEFTVYPTSPFKGRCFNS
jgi:hypothetical protein